MNFPYRERSEATKATIYAKLAADKAAFYNKPKADQPRVLGEMAVLGKTVAEWDKEVALLEEMFDDQRRATGKLETLDVAEHFPAMVSYAVSRWRAAGKPTEYNETAAKLAKLREEAEKHAALAVLQDDTAKRHDEARNTKKAATCRKVAQTQREKAAKFLAEAEALAIEYKKEHP
jgi:hypothetical protein